MDIILNNPFRILGLPITASARVIARRTSDLAIYTAMEKAFSFYRDFPVLGSLQRNPDTAAQAARKIERPQNRLFYSLFWFWRRTVLDEQAFQYLIAGNIRAAILKLETIVGRSSISEKNFSAAKNLSVLFLNQSFSDNTVHTGNLYKGLNLAGRLFQSAFMPLYSQLITGNNITIPLEYLERAFTEEILLAIELKDRVSTPLNERVSGSERGGMSGKSIVKLFETFQYDTKQFLINKLINTPLEKIEAEIDKSRQTRTNEPSASAETGKLLFKRTLKDMSALKSILSRNHIMLQIISDKLANEILQCAIDAFNLSVKQCGETRPEVKPLVLIKCASTVAVGERTRKRIYESFTAIHQWIDSRSVVKRR